MNICALATGRGGAIAIIRVSGPVAIEIVNKHFQPAKTGNALLNARTQSLHYGHFLSVPCDFVAGQSPISNQEPPVLGGSVAESQRPVFGDSVAEPIDEVLISIFRAPHSYTGENAAEISCHASPYIIQQILQSLCQSGCRMALPGEFTQRAFLNGKLDLSQAEAVADLIASQSQSAHRMALSQLKGGFSRELSLLRDQLLHLTTLMELELDFSDHEELEFADRTELINLAEKINRKITSLADSFRQGNAIKNGIPVAIVGAPNVGKSTLLNALLHEDKAIVSDIPGTTRDYIEGLFTLHGIDFRFIDTAGLRQTEDMIERLGIERSRKAVQEAQIIIMMNEPGVDFPELETRPDQTIIRITNKTADFQALNSIGLETLEEQLLAAIPDYQEDSLIVTNARHHKALTNALNSIKRVIQGLKTAMPSDLVAQDLREVLHNLAEITGGEVTTAETLSNIFKNFCIGK